MRSPGEFMGNERLETLINQIRHLSGSHIEKLEGFVRSLQHETTTELSKLAVAQTRNWPHAPSHQLSEHGTFIVTAGTLYKKHFFKEPNRLDF
jgi:hypothetical protein